MTQTTIKNFLTTENQSLQTLMVRIKQLQRWNACLVESIPLEKNLFEHCQIVRYEHGILHIIAENANWATRFRFLIPELLSILRQHSDFQGMQSIQCKICPPHYQPQPRIRQAKKLSKENAEMLKKTIEDIAENTQ